MLVLFSIGIIIYPVISKRIFEKISDGSFLRVSQKTILSFVCLTLIATLFFYVSDILAKKNYQEASANSRDRKPNIVFLTFDSLGTDHFSFYGYKRNTTPNLDKFARESTVFLRMRPNSYWTDPCLNSIIT